MSLLDYQTLVDDLVRDDDDKVSTTQRDNAIGNAALKYSDDKPRVLVEDVTADGTDLLPLPASWEADFSNVLSLEYPIGNSPVSYLENFELYTSPLATKIKLISTITSGNDVRVNFNVAHTISGTDTTPAKHQEAIACYAASILCTQLASLYSSDQDSTIAADNVNHGDKSRRFAKRSDELRDRYHDLLGIDKKRTHAASVFGDFDRKDSRGNDRIYHQGRYR
tara:strand:+ start:139 stop:807 length:669 start_codon:yes stop_codon:yes gene_type:complete